MRFAGTTSILWGPAFRRRGVTADSLLGCLNFHAQLICFLRCHDRLDFAKHVVFLGSDMALDQPTQLLEFGHPGMIIRLKGCEFIQKNFDVAVSFNCFVCLIPGRLRLLKASMDVQIFNCRMALQIAEPGLIVVTESAVFLLSVKNFDDSQQHMPAPR